MQALILAFESEDDFKRRDTRDTDPAAFAAYMKPWRDYSQSLEAAGVIRAGGALEPPHTATTVSMRDGKCVVEDGPYAAVKEQLGGYFLIEVETMADAEHWAALCPAARTGRAEAHQIPNYAEEA